MSDKRNTKMQLKKVFMRMTFYPFTAVVLILFLLYGYQSICDKHKELKTKAKVVANILALTASSKNSDVLLKNQIDLILSTNDTVNDIHFHPITENQSHGIEETEKKALFADTIKELIPVTSFIDNQQVLVGYIYVEIDFKAERFKVLQLLYFELFFSIFLLLSLFFILRLTYKSLHVAMKRITIVSNKLIEGDFDVDFDEDNRSTTLDFRIIEDALTIAAGKLKSQTSQINELVEMNDKLEEKERILFHHQATFQSMITHELRTPLNAIGGGLQLLDTQQLDISAKDSIKLVSQGFNKLNGMLAHIIELNDINQGKVTVDQKVFSPDVLLKEIAQQFSQSFMHKGLTLDISVKHTKVDLLGDVNKIKDIIRHLLDNAIKYTNRGSVTLVSKVTYLDHHQTAWFCSVEDTGIGIAKEFHQEVFKPYIQVDTKRNREYEGSGLGLTLASSLCNLLGGSITVTSNVDEGSCFTVKMNVYDAKKYSVKNSLKNLKILHLQKGKSKFISQALTDLDAQVISHQNRKQALDALGAYNFDIIIICSSLSEEKTINFVQKVRDLETDHKSVIAWLYDNDEQIFEKIALENSGIDYLYKLTDINAFISQLKNWL